MNDSKILSQLIALLRAGLSFHQAERASGVADLSATALPDYQYLRGIVLSSGGKAADAFSRVRQVIEQNQEQLRRVEVANASPRATVRLVLWLPIAALVIGQLVGLGSLQVLAYSPTALTSVLVGAVLLAAGSYWSAHMLRKAREVLPDSAIYLDAIAIAISAGLPTEQAKSLATRNHQRTISLQIQSELQKMLELSKTTGAPLSKLLIEKADSLRGEVQYKKSLALEKLSVRLMIPLGVSVLPAFALIAVVPLAVSFLVKEYG